MRQFIIVGIIDPPSITTIEPPVDIAEFVADVPTYFNGKTMAIIQQEQASRKFYVLRPSSSGFLIVGKYQYYEDAFEYAIQHLLPITSNLSMPGSDSYNSY